MSASISLRLGAATLARVLLQRRDGDATCPADGEGVDLSAHDQLVQGRPTDAEHVCSLLHRDGEPSDWLPFPVFNQRNATSSGLCPIPRVGCLRHTCTSKRSLYSR